MPLAVQAAPQAASVAAPLAEVVEPPLWQRMWLDHIGQIITLSVALTVLTAIFFFQDWLAARPRLHQGVRHAYLLFVLVWLGWYAQAQLSVVNVLAFLNALRSDFRWDYFLMAPLIFILWFATAASLLFWNRGAFCGWLCPFGALQELLNQLARWLKVPQLRIPYGLHSRLVATEVHRLPGPVRNLAQCVGDRGAGCPKSSRSRRPSFCASPAPGHSCFTLLRFWRRTCSSSDSSAATFARWAPRWPFPARLRMFDWLRRYRECGNPCQRCANECPVAGDPSGRPYQSKRVHPVPALPDALSPRSEMPGDDHQAAAARTAGGDLLRTA